MSEFKPLAGKHNSIALGAKRVVKNENFTLMVAFAAIILIFSLINNNFFSLVTFKNILTFGSLVGLIAVGETLLLISGNMDLSPGSVVALAGVVAALLLQAGVSMIIVIPIVLVLGAIIGLGNAFFVNELKISPFIVTLAAQSIYRGIAQILTNGKTISITNPSFIKLGKPIIQIQEAGLLKDIMNFFSYPILIMIAAFIIFSIVLKKTRFGREIYIAGGNPNAARLAGISVKKTTYKLFMIMGILGALGGMILSARMQSGMPSAGEGLEFEGTTAAILGGVAMSGGFGSMSGVILGLFILQGFNSGLVMINVQTFWQSVARGILLILALSADFFRSKQREKKRTVLLDKIEEDKL